MLGLCPEKSFRADEEDGRMGTISDADKVEAAARGAEFAEALDNIWKATVRSVCREKASHPLSSKPVVAFTPSR